jgi:HD superfamily phosphodiesterase
MRALIKASQEKTGHNKLHSVQAGRDHKNWVDALASADQRIQDLRKEVNKKIDEPRVHLR